MRRERNNILAGLFVLGGVALLFAGIVILADFSSFFLTPQVVETRFSLSDGLKGLKEGAAVTIGGANAGKVIAIEDIENEHGVVVAKLVRFTIADKYKVYENAHFALEVPAIGSGTSLNVQSFGGVGAVGEPHSGDWLYQHGQDPPIPGNLATSELVKGFISELGIQETQREQIRSSIRNIEMLTQAVAGDAPDAKLTERARKLAATIANLEATTATLRDQMPQIAEKAKAALDKADGVMASVQGILDENRDTIKSALARADAALEKADNAVATVQAVLDENRPTIKDALTDARATLANTKDITDAFKQDTMARVKEAMVKLDESLSNLRDASGELKGFMATQRPVLERTLANARITSDQLKLASIEVRRAPWRLMYTPSDKELETENLYDAARSFALAAGSLNDTADSLRAILDRYGEKLPADDRNLQGMLTSLRDTFGKFREAEEKFWNALDVTPKPGESLKPLTPIDEKPK